MSKPSEKIIKRRVMLPDGRYLIFYAFGPADFPVPLQPDVVETEAEKETPDEET